MTTTSDHQDALVSVVIGTRNRRPLLERTLQTVLWQTHTALEVLVVDDGSTDDTAAWVGSHPDPRVGLVRQPVSGGVARARNAGLDRATGRFVAITDDDARHPTLGDPRGGRGALVVHLDGRGGHVPARGAVAAGSAQR
jgi:glycosyltransferase involved in cell wall biosynthesis